MFHKLKSFLFNHTSTRQTVIKNTFWLAVSNFGGRFIRAIIIIYAARILGTEGWGIFSYGVTLAAVLTPFADMGIGQILVRDIAKSSSTEERARMLSTALLLKSVLMILGVLIILILAPLFTTIEEAKTILPIIAFLFAFDALREFGFALTRADERMEWEAALFLLTNIAIVGAGFIFLAVSATPVSFTYAYTVGTAVGAFATYLALRHYFPKNLFQYVTLKLIKPMLSAGWPLSIATLLGMLMLNTDILIIGWLRSAEDVGFYSAAYRIVQLFYMIPGVLAWSAFPTFSRLAGTENRQMRSALERMLAALFITAFPLAAGGLILGPEIMEFLFGAAFLPGTPVFQILLITLLVDFPVVVLTHVAIVYNRSKLVTTYAAIGGFSNVLLDFLLIPRFGIVGSAWATLIAQILSTFYLRTALQKSIRFSLFSHLSKALTATAIMAGSVLVLWSSGLHVLPIIILGGIIYGAVLYFLKDPSLKEALHVFRTST